MTPTQDFTSENLNEQARMAAKLSGYTAMKAEANKCTPLDASKAFEMYLGWTDFYRNESYIPVEAEAERSFPIPNSDYSAYGKLDTLVHESRGDGKEPYLVQLEHKTGQRDADSDGVYPFLTANVNEQITTYAMLQSANGQPIHSTVIDYVKVPGIRPKVIPTGKTADSVGTLREIRGMGTYFGNELSSPTKQEYSEGSKIKENYECYRYRVRNDIKENPDRYFARRGPIFRNNVEMLEQLAALEQVTRDIDRANEEKHLGSFYKNTSQCLAYNSTCEYMSLCDGTSTEDSDDWVSRSGGSKTGSKSLSFSKATCFKSCRRKFYHRYVQGIVKRQHEAKSLRIGSLFHVGVEHYYNGLISYQLGDNDE
jgi:hypothetical protein